MGKTSFPLWLRPSKRGLVGRTQESKEGRIPMPPLPFYTITTRTVPITVQMAPIKAREAWRAKCSPILHYSPEEKPGFEPGG